MDRWPRVQLRHDDREPRREREQLHDPTSTTTCTSTSTTARLRARERLLDDDPVYNYDTTTERDDDKNIYERENELQVRLLHGTRQVRLLHARVPRRTFETTSTTTDAGAIGTLKYLDGMYIYDSRRDRQDRTERVHLPMPSTTTTERLRWRVPLR